MGKLDLVLVLSLTVIILPAAMQGQDPKKLREERIQRVEALVKKLNLPLRPPQQVIDNALLRKTFMGVPLQVLRDNFRKAETDREVQEAAHNLFLANYDAVPLLIVEVLDNPSPLHRMYAAQMLSRQQVHHLQALPALLKAHQEDPDEGVRIRAGDRVSLILRWFEGEELLLERMQAQIQRAEALVKQMKLPLRPLEHNINYALRRKAPDGTPLHVLLDRFRKAETDQQVRDAVLPLQRAGFDAVPLLIVEVLDNPRPFQRLAAASALVNMNNYLQALPAILKTHKEDPVVAVRFSAGKNVHFIMTSYETQQQRMKEALKDLLDYERRLLQREKEEKAKHKEEKK